MKLEVLVSEDEDLFVDEVPESARMLDARESDCVEQLGSLLEPGFFGEAADCLAVRGLSSLDARKALQLIEQMLAADFAQLYVHLTEFPRRGKRRRKYHKLLEERGSLRFLRGLGQREAVQLAQRVAAELKLETDVDTLELLVDRLGTSPVQLRRELEARALSGLPLQRTDVEQLFSSRRESFFDLVQLALTGQMPEVHRRLRQIEMFEDFFPVAWALANGLHRLYMVKLAGPRAADLFWAPKREMDAYAAVAQRIDFWQAEALMELAVEIDQESKTTPFGWSQIYMALNRIQRVLGQERGA